jgi:nicotinamidase-related amidase
MKNLPLNAALLIIDVQKAIDHPGWGQRNNPQMEKNVMTLLSAWRQTQRPVIHVRHNSCEPLSTYRPGQEGNEFKPEVMPAENECIIGKQTNSAFIGTDLEKQLRAAGIETLVITGVITNNSVEATVRMAGNLGFETFVVADGTATFGRNDYNGIFRTADEVHAMSLANMDREYATIVTTDEVLMNI